MHVWRLWRYRAYLTVRHAMHVGLKHGRNVHHIIEAAFKGLGRCFRDAVRIEGTEVPSTKGVL